MVMTLKNYYRQGAARVRQAEDRGVPVYVLRNNTTIQMERQLVDVFQLREVAADEDGADAPAESENPVAAALLEAELAIGQVLNGERRTVELQPRSGYVRRLQHQLAERYNVQSESRGREPHRRVKFSR
jgi:hypothetical protein